MESGNKSNGWQTFHEHFGLPILATVALLATLFTNVTGTLWIECCAASFALMVLGGCLITWAKLPIYRHGGFMTFGVKSVPQKRRKYYEWGWFLFLLGAGCALCLFFSI